MFSIARRVVALCIYKISSLLQLWICVWLFVCFANVLKMAWNNIGQSHVMSQQLAFPNRVTHNGSCIAGVSTATRLPNTLRATQNLLHLPALRQLIHQFI